MNDELKNWRKQIDAIDKKIIDSLAERIEIVKKIGKYKKEKKISALDKKRWQEILQYNLSKAQRLGLPKKFIKDLLNLIHKQSLRFQKKG